MRITRLTIKKYGRIDMFDYGLGKLDVVETPYIEEISTAIAELIYSDYLRPNLPQINTNNDTFISCDILAYGRKICEQITFENNVPVRKFFIDNKEVENIDDFPINDNSFEQEMTSLFLNTWKYKNCMNFLSFQDYKNYFAFYKGSKDKKLPSSEFSFLFCEKYFRSLLNNYIMNLKPIWINQEKGIYLKILRTGEFESFKIIDGKEKRYSLSTTEKTVFFFMCFLEIGRFWGEINKIRDFNWESKPLIAINLLERIDYSFDCINYIKHLKQNRQIIILKEKINKLS